MQNVIIKHRIEAFLIAWLLLPGCLTPYLDEEPTASPSASPTAAGGNTRYNFTFQHGVSSGMISSGCTRSPKYAKYKEHVYVTGTSYLGERNSAGSVIFDPTLGAVIGNPLSIPIHFTYSDTIVGYDTVITGAFYIRRSDGNPDRVIRVLADGSVDTTFNLAIDDNGGSYNVTQVLRDSTSGALYVAGGFHEVTANGVFQAATGSLIKVDPTTGALDVGFNTSAITYPASVNKRVNTMSFVPTPSLPAPSRAILIAGTDFGGNSAYLTLIHPETGAEITGGSLGFDGEVSHIITDGNQGIAVGTFSNALGTAHAGAVHFMVNAFGIITDGGNFAGNYTVASGSISTSAVDGTYVYLGGNFTNFGGGTQDALVRLNKATGVLDAGWNPAFELLTNDSGIKAAAVSLKISGSDLIAAGNWNKLNGNFVGSILSLDTAGATETLNWDLKTADPCWLIPSGSNLQCIGSLTSVGGLVSDGLFKVNPITGVAQAIELDTNYIPISLAIVEDRLYLSGMFTTIGGQSRDLFAELDLTQDPPTVTALNLQITPCGTDAPEIFTGITALFIYTGCDTINSVTYNPKPIIKYTGGNSITAPTVLDVNLGGSNPRTIKEYAEGLYISRISSVGGTPVPNLARVNVNTGALEWYPNNLTVPANPDVVFSSSEVSDYIKDPNSDWVYVHGVFNSSPVAEATDYYIGRFSATTGSLDTSFKPAILGVGEYNGALYLKNNTLWFFGGNYDGLDTLTGVQVNGQMTQGVFGINTTTQALTIPSLGFILQSGLTPFTLPGDPDDTLFLYGYATGPRGPQTLFRFNSSMEPINY